VLIYYSNHPLAEQIAARQVTLLTSPIDVKIGLAAWKKMMSPETQPVPTH
jgi:hypothetical protein